MISFDDEGSSGNQYRREYLDSVKALITQRQKLADADRAGYMIPESLKEDPEGYRRDYADMLGWPLNTYIPGNAPAVRTIYAAMDEKYRIDRLQLEIFPGFWFYGILFTPTEHNDKLPLVISQHGGLGTPELCSGLEGSSSNYNDMTQRVLDREAVVFAPQLLLWNKERYGDTYDRIQIDAMLKQFCGSITALEIYCIRKCIDYLVTLPVVDKDRIGMIGLSYGGFYTLYTAASETRIKTAYSSCAFNNRYAYPWPDWVWNNSAYRFLDAEVAALVAPRALYIEVGDNDELFGAAGAQREFDRVTPFFAAQNAGEKLRFHIFEGVHELCRLDTGLEFFFSHL